MKSAILVLNAGSSSLKFALYGADDLAVLCRGAIESIGGTPRVKAIGPPANALQVTRQLPPGSTHEGTMSWLIDALGGAQGVDLAAAGHRIVHGGPTYAQPVLIDDAVEAALNALVPLAPAHQPHNLAGVRAVRQTWPTLPQVACFDTAFHRTQPRLAQLFAIPRVLSDEGMLRYGFHGLSYEHVADILPDIAGARSEGRVLVAHLGHGASLCAMKGRLSVATTMGLTALDGLMMGTRSGAIDPGLVLHLIREWGMHAAEVADLLNSRSGLLGVSGISDDVRVLLASDDLHAKEALDLFAYRTVHEAGSLIAANAGLDVLVFTAGIGENAPSIRAAICDGLAWTDLMLDPERNAAGKGRISRAESKVDVYVVAADEEQPIARAVRRIV